MSVDAFLLRPDPVTEPIALFLDVDGTLIDIVADHTAAKAPAGLVPVIGRLAQALGGALAIVSGRPLAVIDRILHPLLLPAAGVHGAEVRLSAEATVQHFTAALDAATVDAVRRAVGNRPGLRVEAKRFAVAVHYRLAPLSCGEVTALLDTVLRDCHDPSALSLRHGRKVVEVMPATVSKGTALERFMLRPPFHGRRPVMIGDDLTDESALAVARGLHGLGLRVAGEHFAFPEAEFAGPAHVRDWLATLVERLEA